MFTTFLGDDVAKEKLSVYTSNDGLNFKLLANTGYGGPTGVLRDPSIMKHKDGKYYVAYTLQSWTTNSSSFGIAVSEDLRAWKFLKEVPSGVTGATYTWAPEWFQDADGVHLIVSIQGAGNADFRAYDFKAKDDALMEWEAPAPLGIGPNYIDTFIVKVADTYHAFSKNETTKYIEHATASALHGPWNWIGKGDWAGWGSGKEGISLFRLDDGQWRMFLDCYSGCGFLYADSDDLTNWSGTMTVGGISGVRHGTVLREEMDAGGASSGGSGGGAGAAGQSGAGAGGSSSNGGRAGAANGGAGTGGAMGGASAGTHSSAGASGSAAGALTSGGASSASGGSATTSSGGALASGGASGGGSATTAGSANAAGGASQSTAGAKNGTEPSASVGCGCSLAAAKQQPAPLVALALSLLGIRRRLRRRSGELRAAPRT